MSKKLAVVTGASSGIGRELARQLAGRGYDLLLVARRADRLRALASEIDSTMGKQADVLALDLTLPAERKTLTSRMEASEDRLALAVNNAGFGLIGPTWTGPLERLAGMIGLNITALTEISHSAARIMSRKRSGGLINVASTAAFQAVPYLNVYSATKAYVLSFTEGLAEELAPHGVRVMALCPGPTESEFQAVAGVRQDVMRTRIAMTAEECVRIGLEDFERGKRISITGWGNKLQVFGTWLAPRNLVTKAAKRMMQSRLPISD
jgi:uncharacterized protein